MTYEEQERTVNQILEEKFGKFATIEIGSFWNGTKEEHLRNYLKSEMKRLEKSYQQDEYIKINNILFSKSMLSRRNYYCAVCGKYNYKLDDLRYSFKYETCQRCYIRYIEDRELRWKEGWRPNGR
jgi:hypothetical protein